jgi:predicted MFS family arabinose efflux permease
MIKQRQNVRDWGQRIDMDRKEIAVSQQGRVQLTEGLLWTMTIASGVAVANIYYNQPMLTDMGRSLHCSAHQIGFVATATQAGYALGMPLFIPLADFVERRKLLSWLFAAAALSSLAAALSFSLPLLIVASLLVGATSVIAQILIPFATEIAEPERQGHVIGRLLSGLLLGILLARTLSGFVARYLGWRAMFVIAAVLSLVLCMVLAIKLPRVPAHPNLSYVAFMRSLVRLPFELPSLLGVSVCSGMFFAAFITFWTTLVFFLETPPYHYGSQTAGLFGLIGAVGALVAPWAGKLADRRSPKFVLRIAVCICLAAFGVFYCFGTNFAALILGVVLLDAGCQAAQVSNQSRAFSLLPHAHNRVNTIYMMIYFVGGTAGSFLGTWAWDKTRWSGVCCAGAGFLLVAALFLIFAGRVRPQKAQSSC